MIEVILGSMIYYATLVDCYDGDSCTLNFAEVPIFLQTQQIRFIGFDTPEIRGKCRKEKRLAKKARALTLNYMRDDGKIRLTGERDKYGRLLAQAPELQQILIDADVAVLSPDGKRNPLGWC